MNFRYLVYGTEMYDSLFSFIIALILTRNSARFSKLLLFGFQNQICVAEITGEIHVMTMVTD